MKHPQGSGNCRHVSFGRRCRQGASFVSIAVLASMLTGGCGWNDPIPCEDTKTCPTPESGAAGVAGASGAPESGAAEQGGTGEQDGTAKQGGTEGHETTSGGSAGRFDDRGTATKSGGSPSDGGEAGAPVVPTNCDATQACRVGDYDCHNDDLYSCERGSDDCPTWSLVTHCEGELPLCNATKGACECDLAARSTCLDASTVRRCLSGAWSVEACPGDRPTCNAEAGVCECDPEDPPQCADNGTVSTCEDGLWIDTPCPDDTPVCSTETASCECDRGSQSDYCDDDGLTLRSCEDGAWVGTACEGDTPICNTDTDRCECDPEAARTCSNDTTVRYCDGGTWRTESCTGDTPLCNPDVSRCECDSSAPDECADSDTIRRCVDGELQSVSCASLDATLPTCNTSTDQCECTSAQQSSCNGSTWVHCSGGSWASQSCSGDTPACDPSAGCVPCFEHAQCPGSACHLSESSANYGSCFLASQVQDITSSSGLQTALEGLTGSTVAVWRLSNQAYPVHGTGMSGTPIPQGAEVAILGTTGSTITGGDTGVYSPRVAMVTVTGILYISNVDINSPQCSMTALESSPGASPSPAVWLDDLALTDFTTTLYMRNADTHIRRSVIRSGSDCSIYVVDGSLYTEISVFGPETVAFEYSAVCPIGSPYLDVRYCTIWGHKYAVDCGDGTTWSQGTVRNSILIDEDVSEGSIHLCNEVTFMGNAGTGTGVLPDSTWFANVANHDFHLTATGANQLGRTATWAPGDPTVDIDGEARPQDSTGNAGIDER